MVAASIWSSSEDAVRLVSQSHGVSLVRITDYSSPLGSRVYVGHVQSSELGAPLPRTLTASSHSFSRILDRFYLPDAGDPNAAAALFDAIADSYETIVNREQNLRLNEVLLGSCLEALGPDRPLTVLDFGCGPGFSVQALRNLGASAGNAYLVGTDASPAMMSRAEMNDLRTMPLEIVLSGSIRCDAVIACFVLHLGIDLSEISAVCRTLRPGGVFVGNYFRGEAWQLGRLRGTLERLGGSCDWSEAAPATGPIIRFRRNGDVPYGDVR